MPFSTQLQTFFQCFLKDEEKGLSLSPIYLLLGCGLPLWVSSQPDILAYSGIILLGIGDTAVIIFC